MSRRALARMAAFVLLSLSVLQVQAQAQDDAIRNFPNKPIRIIVGFAAGGGSDVLARIVGTGMSEALGRPVIVENKPGAQGIIGVEFVMKSAPDGYTVLMGPIGPMAMNPAIYAKLPYSPLRDFVPITMIGSYPLVLLVSASAPIRSVGDLVEFAKARPKDVNYASNASLYQLASELFKQKTGTQFVHIPYKSSGESMNALMAGQVTMAMMDPPTAMGPLKSEKVRALAVTSAARYSAWPGVPSMAELGISDLEVMIWSGFFVPAGTPPAIVKKLEVEIARTLKLPDIRKRLNTMGVDPIGNTSEEFGRIVASDIARWTAVAKAANIKAD